ncbi:MAG TPA: DUF4097 family beta strand repeat-containing protein [Oligoflexus sp.]|uniref:DUF4097 family beta strand repeat-containing protein n=1 Tax=Oligoflexus sp. TaxID=1971216 RepID=UPI002D54C52B|nr:DUF4097 family beta strand repeat-containing protein [Oligoflexus sp.]HYX33850.1 DUF4097 family beta strand repeat-containing protein [Oligoflexus sp.]
MENRMKNIAIGLGAFTLITFGLGKFFDSRCASSCIGEAFAANTKDGLNFKGLEDLHIFVGDDDKDRRGGKTIHISNSDSGDSLGGDENNPLRKKEPLTESFTGKGLKDIEINSYVTDWKITESADDQIRFVFTGYLPPKEWTVIESVGELKLEVTKKGPLQGEIQLPKGFAGELEFTNITGNINVEKLALADSFEVTSVSGDLTLMAAPTKELSINTVSGDVKLEPGILNKALAIDYNSVSGDLNATLKSGIKKFEANSVSGDVNFKAARTVAFNFEMEGVSASFEGLPSSTKTDEGFGHRGATGSFGEGPKGELTFNSVSGDFNLKPAE